MAEVNPKILAYVRNQIATEELAEQRREQQAAIQGEIKRVRQAVLTDKAFHRSLPSRSVAMDDKLPSPDAFFQQKAFSSSNAVDINSFFDRILFGGKQRVSAKGRR